MSEYFANLSQEKLDSILKILTESRMLKQEERRLKEAQAEILRLERLPIINPQPLLQFSPQQFNQEIMNAETLMDPFNGLASMVDDLTFDPSTLVNFDEIKPTQVFKEAAAKGRKNTSVLEEECKCSNCCKNIGTLLLRGKQEAFERAYTVQVICSECDDTRTESKKRTRQQPIECDACRCIVGRGGVRLTGCDSEPEFSVELVCKNCCANYLFCMWCGGTRAGKTGLSTLTQASGVLNKCFSTVVAPVPFRIFV